MRCQRWKGTAEAKGKIEKAFGYLQRRVPYLCERYGIRSVCEAQKIVQEVVGFYNEHREPQETREVPLKRWEQALEAGKGRLSPLILQWTLIWSSPFIMSAQ